MVTTGNGLVIWLEFCQWGRSGKDLFIFNSERCSNHKNNSGCYQHTRSGYYQLKECFIPLCGWHVVLGSTTDKTSASEAFSRTRELKEAELTSLFLSPLIQIILSLLTTVKELARLSPELKV